MVCYWQAQLCTGLQEELIIIDLFEEKGVSLLIFVQLLKTNEHLQQVQMET